MDSLQQIYELTNPFYRTEIFQTMYYPFNTNHKTCYSVAISYVMNYLNIVKICLVLCGRHSSKHTIVIIHVRFESFDESS